MTVVLIFILGACIGSFLNVVIDRLPANKSIMAGRSYCDHCRKKILWHDLIPLISFFMLAGKCRFCRKKISWQYPVVELTTGILFAYSYSYSLSPLYFPEAIYLLVTISCLIAIFFTDLKYRIIPDQILAIMAFSTLVYLFAFNKNQFFDHLLAGTILFIVFISMVLVTKGRGMGLGDVKFAFVMGFLLGFPKIIITFYLAFLTGAGISVILIIAGKKTLKSTVPFGPFLTTGTMAALFYGDMLWSLLRRIIGI